ncbi:MAG: formate dehydrogenase subunit gamma [Alphaproteobacteria bacterium]|nr:formate dehydrogenase subunit gamma [Alphaproteobacteria bacterium]
MIIRSFLLLLALTLGAMTLPAPAFTADDGPVSGVVPGESLGSTSDADLWRAVRAGQSATISIPDREAAVLIQSEGENWRNIRNGPISTIGGWLLIGVIVLICLYFAIRGRIRIEGGRSGILIPRFTQMQRVGHWFVAALFILLGLTGLTLLYGRYGLPYLIGKEGFAILASASLQAHNLFGPLFMASLIVLFFTFLKGNIISRVDIVWMAKLGGFFGGHASSRFYNFGEKNWFWMSISLGLILSFSGILLNFPGLMEDRYIQQLAHISHAISALIFIAVGLGHIYLGVFGVEGAVEGMTTGAVDANWAKEHHDLWYEEVMAEKAAESGGE